LKWYIWHWGCYILGTIIGIILVPIIHQPFSMIAQLMIYAIGFFKAESLGEKKK